MSKIKTGFGFGGCQGAFLKTLWIEKNIKYDGSQLRPLFAYETQGLLGTSIVAFRGACDVSWDHMKDLEDLRARSPIRGSDMLHFILEIFDSSLWGAVAFQRLMASVVAKVLCDLTEGKLVLVRDGDDLYTTDRKKLSISIANKNLNSVMIHFAVNISNEGTPIPTCSLNDFGVDPFQFSKEVLLKVSREYQETLEATQKVR